jgi:hypothetical protein
MCKQRRAFDKSYACGGILLRSSTPLRIGKVAEPASEDERRAAFGYLNEAWEEARLDGIDGDCLAQVALFTAINELVSTYGEEAAAQYAEGLSDRIRRGEFTIPGNRQ